MSIKKKIKNKLNAVARRTTWYESVFPDCKKFWNQCDFCLDVVNLGSSSAKYAFHYENTILKTANWAMAPQTFVGDYAIITNYCSFLKEGATVFLSLCPFSSLGGGNDILDDKYYSILRPISIPYYSITRRNRILDIKNHPFRYFPIYNTFKGLMPRIKNRHMNSLEMDKDADHWINSWKKEFSIYNLNNSFALINQDRFDDSVQALSKLIDFCISHSYHTYLVMPPMSKHLSVRLNENVRHQFIYDFVEKANKGRVPFLNYIDDDDFVTDDLFRNSYLLNEKGARKFACRLLNDIKI